MSVHPIPFTLCDGKEITVQGVAHPDAERFSINLCSGDDYETDTSLHFNPRFDDSQVVRNHFAGEWGEEERHGDFPFTQGETYEVKIVVQEQYYQIFVNGSNFCDFVHRLPKDVARNVFVTGDTTVTAVTFNEGPHRIPFELNDGKEIKVRGLANPGIERFSINLCSGPSYDTDKTLHFNPRFECSDVVRNHYDGDWGDEERDGDFTFTQGESYEVKIVTRDSHFKIFVNDDHFCDFNHRLPKEVAKYVVIDGETTVYEVSFSNNSPIMNPAVPFTTQIPSGLYPGRRIHISGRPTQEPSRFSVNLMNGTSFEDAEVALHFDARFDFGGCQNQVVRTSRIGGGYGEEEMSEGYFPFVPDVPFEVAISVDPESYTIEINGQYFCTFNHRLQPIQSVDSLNIHGDVELFSVRFE